MIRRILPCCVVLLLLCIHNGLSRQVGSSSKSSNSRSASTVELMWGIEETHTPLGKLFNFTIPKDAFAGEIADIKVTEAGQPALPSWLTFDPKTRQFIGLPILAKDARAHYIAVTVFGVSAGQSVQDVFTLIVQEGDAKPECTSEAAQTVLTLMLDLDWDSMSMPKKTALLGKFSSYMDIQVADFKVSPVTGSGTASLFDSSAIVAGPGNAKEVKFPTGGIKLSSVVGCDGNIDGNKNNELTTFVEEAAKDGSMATFTGVDVLGWTLTTAKPVPSQRIRRQNNFINTPEPSPILATIQVQPGGGVRATPYLSVQGGQPTDYVHPTAVLPGIQPTGTSGQGVVRPTAAVAGSGLTPHLQQQEYPITPTPPLPPPRMPDMNRGGEVGPKAGKPIADSKPIVAVAGQEFRFQLPKDAFVSEAATTVRLQEGVDKDVKAWLKLESKPDGAHVLHGLPLNENEGSKEYHLDVSGAVKTIQLPFKIQVQVAKEDTPATSYNHEAEVVLNEDYADFNVDRRLQFLDTLRTYYDDEDSRHIVVRGIESGSTVVKWTNSSYVGADGCKDGDYALISNKLVLDDGTVNPAFQRFAGDKNFKVDKVTVRKIGPCAATATTQAPDIALSMIVPIVVVCSLLLIALCIGCILYKKKRRGKMTPEPDQIFVGKNKPVIFKGEINETNNNGAKGNNGASKKPAVLADERPAVPPPTYTHRSPAAGYVVQHDDIDHGSREEQQALLTLSTAGDPGQPPHLTLGTSSRK
ncbi:putative Dystroglycan [Hypsibius exemplaris]|uniref:Dystroglycan 1 n=1 Tax=Hypsibius exemplaris TaxID=2072580 RepID=A0A1W0X6S2_HYPEX|nr:putative Dystroglycan [Hypsibius exemplaris]